MFGTVFEVVSTLLSRWWRGAPSTVGGALLAGSGHAVRCYPLGLRCAPSLLFYIGLPENWEHCHDSCPAFGLRYSYITHHCQVRCNAEINFNILKTSLESYVSQSVMHQASTACVSLSNIYIDFSFNDNDDPNTDSSA